MIYAYIRVSTDKQDCANQRIGIDSLAGTMNLAINRYIEDDGISGTREPEKRALGGLLQELQPGDIIICSELSRLGRKLFMIMRVLEHIMSVGAKLYTVKEGYELGDNIQAKVMAFAFGLSAEIERDLISQRTKEALQRKKLKGEPIGRPKGSHNIKHKLDGTEQCILQALQSNKSKAHICRQLNVSMPTLNFFIKYKNIHK